MPNGSKVKAPRLDRLGLIVLVAAAAIAAMSARPYVGGWNDGSRFATAESLVDYHPWAIDRSIFAGAHAASGGGAYSPDERSLRDFGTRDKMWINGHFYSDKPPVPNLALAILY